MRTVEVLQIVGAFVGAFASVAIGFEQKILKNLRIQSAISPESAVALQGLKPISRWRLSRLLKHGVVRRAGEGLFYFDEDSFRMLRKRRIRIAIPAVIAALALVVLLHRFVG